MILLGQAVYLIMMLEIYIAGLSCALYDCVSVSLVYYGKIPEWIGLFFWCVSVTVSYMTTTLYFALDEVWIYYVSGSGCIMFFCFALFCDFILMQSLLLECRCILHQPFSAVAEL